MRKLRSLPMLALAMVAMTATTANAATWLGGTGDYLDGANWDTGVAPAFNENQILNSGTANTGSTWLSVGGNATITIDGATVNAQGRKAAIGAGGGPIDPGVDRVWGYLELNSGTLRFAGNVNNETFPSFEVGNYGDGWIFQSGGDLIIEEVGPTNGSGPWSRINLGGGSSRRGRYYISGGTLTAGRLGNGFDGSGELRIQGGAATITLDGERGPGTEAYRQNGGSKLVFEIGNGSPGITTIDASAGTMGLDGTLEITFFEPTTVGARYDLITYGGITGGAGSQHTNLDLLVDSLLGPDTVQLALHKSANGGTTYQIEVIDVALSGLSGDYNNSGTVDLADYTIWRNNLGAPAGTLPNDFVGDVIDADQYAAWKANFGDTVGAIEGISTRAVPEPGTLAIISLIFIGLTPLIGRRESRAFFRRRVRREIRYLLGHLAAQRTCYCSRNSLTGAGSLQ